MDGGFNVLVTGETGVGKSVVISDFLMNTDKDRYVNSGLNFSA
jgi:dynein heavy chain